VLIFEVVHKCGVFYAWHDIISARY